MSVSIDIVPLTESLDMYGEPDKSSAFSLSGHVSIALSSPYSMFERRRAARVLLQSVVLTFDSQTEVVTPTLGYSPLRLCSISRELAPSEPVELTNEGHEDFDEPCRWNVVFDLPIPGWLPASHSFGNGDLGASTVYFLHAKVKFAVIEDQWSTSWSFTTLCSPFRSLITLRRFVEPPTDEPTAPGLVLGSVSKYIDVCDDALPFTLRLRMKDLENAECKRLQVESFKIDVVQEEKCRQVIHHSPDFLSHYPVPPLELQPPHKPLFNAHHVCDLYQLGLVSCAFSLLPPTEPGVYKLSGDTHIFAQDVEKDSATWYTLETTVPVRPSAASPLYDVSHVLKLLMWWQGGPVLRDPAHVRRVAPPLPPRDIHFASGRLPDGAYPRCRRFCRTPRTCPCTRSSSTRAGTARWMRPTAVVHAPIVGGCECGFPVEVLSDVKDDNVHLMSLLS
ncbi:hypothetical protein B0H10DRAFT_1981880 [Mycena sp. CBHHK59/15]|nr:hypothetical protein B0H10DRAFT_1981880 [Mycena sp. CBHHK59/15]